MSDNAKYYYVSKFNLELAIDEAVSEVFYDDVVEILPQLIQNTSNEKYFKRYIFKRLPGQDWSMLKEKQDKFSRAEKAYSLEMFGFIEALSRHIIRRSFKIIKAFQGDREWSGDSSASDTKPEPPITLFSSSIAADKSKSVVSQKAPEEEIDISFTEEDQSTQQLRITKTDQPKMDKDPPQQSSTPEKGKTLGRNDKQADIYASWSLKEQKEREQYQVVIEQPPKDMNTTTLTLKENISSLIQRDIRMFKEVKLLDGSRKIIGYLSTWDNMKECIDKPMTNKIKTSKRSNTNKSQNLSPKSNTVGTGSNRIPIGNRKSSKQVKKTEDEPFMIPKRSSDSTKKTSLKKPWISKKKLAADIATIMETLKSLVRQ
ncbi:hypothetical protein GLOIN_2v1773466 [Rhizophagus clarus]|uniref:Uncharacterized protein n=1 Tax=Rhizophagus clarus TaxID=94130 RepID=A0A8H3M9I6_9GLOM|nr:hypothetical protein GLOIN_2v1773466 [Rhizophagus clarus]